LKKSLALSPVYIYSTANVVRCPWVSEEKASGGKQKRVSVLVSGIKRAEVRKTASGARVSLLEPIEPNTHIQN